MNPPVPAVLRLTETTWRGILLVLSAAVILFTVWCLSHGITIIFMHLYYFPIVLLAYHYRWKGFWLSIALAAAYLGLVVLFSPGQPDVIIGAVYRFLVFAGIAAIIAYLSENLLQAQRARQESTEVKEQYISLAPAIILVLDRNGAISYMNPKGCAILECQVEGVIGKPWVDTFIKADERESVRSLFAGIIRGGPDLYRMVEGDVVTATGRLRYIRWYTTLMHDTEGAITGVLSYGEDITEEKRVERGLSESEERYRTLAESITDNIFIIDRDDTIRFVNTHAAETLHLPADEIVGKPRKKFFPPDVADHQGMILQKAFETGEPSRNEERIVLGNQEFWQDNALIPLKDETGNVTSVIGVSRDISERKRVELELASAYVNLKEAYRLAHIGTWNWVMENDTMTWSEELYNIAGRNPSLPAPTYAEMPRIYTPASWNLLNAAVTNALTTAEPYNLELELVRPDGSIRWINAFGGVQRDGTGKVIGLHGTLQDITSLKKAEEMLKFKNILLSTQQEVSIDGILVVDGSGKIISFNKRFIDLWGILPDVIASGSDERALQSVIDTLADPEEFISRVNYLYTNRDEKSREEIVLKDGRVFDRYSAPMAGNDGMYYGRVWYFRDITDRKQMETALILSEQTYRSYVDNSPGGIFVADSTGRYLDVNRASCDLLGYSREELLAMNVLDLALPEERQQILDQFMDIQEKLKTESSVSLEMRLKKKDGSACPVILSVVKLPSDTIMGFTLDITGRKAAEDALRESRQLFSDIISFLPDPTFVIDKQGTVLAWNRALEQLSGVPAADMIGKGDHEYSIWMYGKKRPILIDLVLNPDQDAGRLNNSDIHLEGRTVTAQTEITRPGSDQKIPLSLVASPLIDSQGKITGAIESMRDISRLKEAEAELARINKDLEQIVRERTRALQEEIAQRMHAEKDVQAALDYTRSVIEANPDLMVVLDAKGIVLDINATGELLTGIPKEQLIGKRYFIYLVDDGTLFTAFSGLLKQGTMENVVRIRRTDGHVTPLSVHATVIRGTEGKEDRIIVAGHDITRQIQDEEAIRASLEEKVILLREVHHRVKNNLQIIISLVNLQMRQTDDPGMKQIMAETQNRVRAMSLVHEKLYRSESLSRIDFADYIRFLTTQLFSFYGTDTRRVRLDLAMGKIMVDINTAVPLGLLMNELVSNALKHAFPGGKEGTISVSGVEEGDHITLVVRDNGIGIPEELDWKNTTSLGMRLVTSLIDQIDGTITLDRKNGTVFTVTLERESASGGAG